MSVISQIIFFILLMAIFFSEGLGIKNGRTVAYYLILIMPFFLYTIDSLKKKMVKVPNAISLLFLVFFIMLIFSTITSVNVESSAKHLLYVISCFLLFIYAYNHKEELLKLLPIYILIITMVFVVYSIFLTYFLPEKLLFLIPQRGYQYVYSYYRTHNPLGSFLIIPLTLFLYRFFYISKKYIIIILFLFPIFLLSYSRASYVSIVLIMICILGYGLCTKKIKVSFWNICISLILSVSCIVFLFSVTHIRMNLPIITKLNTILIEKFGLYTKSKLSMRDEYYRIAVSSIKDKPLLGVGLNNVIYASIKYGEDERSWAETSDNIFLEMMVEGGIIIGILFMVFCSMILFNKKPFFHKIGEFYFVFIAMLLLFQLDSSQRFYSYFFLFFLIAALNYVGDTYIVVKNRYAIIVPITLFFVAQIMLYMRVL